MENTLEKGKGLKADLKNPNMLNDDAMNQVTGGVSALESAIKGVSGFADFFSLFSASSLSLLSSGSSFIT